MILEIAEVHVTPGSESAFIAAVTAGQHLFMQTPGYLRHQLQQSIEEPTRFMLLIEWETIESHTVGFRESERFPQWREYISPHFAKAPLVQHFELRLSNTALGGA
jgi:heme-degrading monooxygenase HmoA